MLRTLKNAFSFLLFAGLLLVLVGVARPAFADPIAQKSPQYAEITQTLAELTRLQSTPNADLAAAGYTAAELSQKISDLRFQKYIQETSEDLGICSNTTASTVGVYGYDPDRKNAAPQIAYLGAGQTTDDDWACTGVFLPADAVVAGLDLGGEGAIAALVDGTRLTISENPATGAIEFDVPLYKVLKAADTATPLPQFSLADVAGQVATAPID
ncbi:hypothetical protein IQ265_26970 [Nodosilinea sp. LEGE 06152]|uniref:hypothetical protein n=1 Tax=Nodosilinea sp. LEGE 06152 TaxID=2777966 RepID=UPI00188285FC|nr:hypothetical protein [Nodosilinea sp. LEGE 06152]MBE9160436.1 hypothetical protein [Nodosilinea sp. LEGE 06152]